MAGNEEGQSLLVKMKEESEEADLKLNLKKKKKKKTKTMASSPITSWQRGREKVQPWNSKMIAPWKESYNKPRQCIKKQRQQFGNKRLHCQSSDFSSSHVRTWELDYEEGRAPKNWCLQTVVLKTISESPMDSKKIKLVNSKRNQHWILVNTHWNV